MQNVAIFAAAPIKSAQVVSDGRPLPNSAPGFLQQLLELLTGEPDQSSSLAQEEVPGLTREATEEVPEQAQTEAMSGALAMLLALPIQQSVPNVIEQTSQTAAALAVGGEAALGTDQPVVSTEELNPQVKSGDSPEAGTYAKQAETVAGAASGTNQSDNMEAHIDASAIAETDTPAPALITRKPAMVISGRTTDKPGKSPVDEIVGHLWRQSLIARQQPTRLQAEGPSPATATEPEQPLGLDIKVLTQAEPVTQTEASTVALNNSLVETSTKEESTAISEKASPEQVILHPSGAVRQERASMLGKHGLADASPRVRVDEDTVSSKPARESADSLKDSIEFPLTPAGNPPEEHTLAENDLAGLGGLRDTVRISGMDLARQSTTGAQAPPKAWPTPHEQVLRGLESGIKQLQASRMGERTTVKLQLFPEELGEVRVKLELVGQTVTAQFEATSTTTANLLKDGLPILRQALDAQGFSEVSLTAGFAGDFSQAREGRDDQASRQRQRANYSRPQQVVLDTGGQEVSPKLAHARLDYRL